jgi:hypothetical protein
LLRFSYVNAVGGVLDAVALCPCVGDGDVLPSMLRPAVGDGDALRNMLRPGVGRTAPCGSLVNLEGNLGDGDRGGAPDGTGEGESVPSRRASWSTNCRIIDPELTLFGSKPMPRALAVGEFARRLSKSMSSAESKKAASEGLAPRLAPRPSSAWAATLRSMLREGRSRGGKGRELLPRRKLRETEFRVSQLMTLKRNEFD